MRITDVLAAFAPPALRESTVVGTIYNDPDVNLTAEQGGSRYYRRLTQAQRDLPQLQQERMLEIAYYLYDSNPLAKRVLEMLRDFVLGEGVTVSSAEPDEKQRVMQQAVLDAFWNDHVNYLDLRLYDWVFELGLAGELCLAAAANPKDGSVRLTHIGSGQVSSVDVLQDGVTPYAITLKTALGDSRSRRLKVVAIDEDVQSADYGRMAGAETDENGVVTEEWFALDASGNRIGPGTPYAGSCFFFAINKPAEARRGRSDILTLIDWIDMIDQILANEADRHLLLRSFIWDVTLENASEEQIAEFLKANSAAPRPGTVRAHPKNVTWNAVTPDLKPSDTAQGADLLLKYVATGSGLPKTWLGSELDVNRATAQELGEPAYKRLTMRQRYIRYMLEQIIRFVLDQAELHGRLLKRKSEKGSLVVPQWPVVVQLPELRSKDLKMSADTLQSAATALAAARADKVIDVQVQQDTFVLLLSQLGIDVDVEAMRERLEQEAEGAAEVPPPVPELPPAGEQAEEQEGEVQEESEVSGIVAEDTGEGVEIDGQVYRQYRLSIE